MGRLLNFFQKNEWTQGANARNAEGNPVDYYSGHATCWCLFGGFCKVYGEVFSVKDVNEPYAKLHKAIWDKFTIAAVSIWNDLPTTTKKDVLALIGELDL